MTLITDAPLGIPRNQGSGFAMKDAPVLQHLRHVLFNFRGKRSTRHGSNKNSATKSWGARHGSILSAGNMHRDEERGQDGDHNQDTSFDHRDTLPFPAFHRYKSLERS